MLTEDECAPVGWTGATAELPRLGWRNSILHRLRRWWWRRRLQVLAPPLGAGFEPGRSLALDRAMVRLEAEGGRQ